MRLKQKRCSGLRSLHAVFFDSHRGVDQAPFHCDACAPKSSVKAMPGENKIYYEGVIRDLHAALRLHFFKTESGCFCVTCTSFRLLPLARLHHQLHFLLKWFHFVFYACNIRRYWRQDAKHGSSQFSVVDLVVTNNWAPFLFFLVLTALRIHLRSTDRALDITTILVFWGVAEGTQKKKKTGELRAGKKKRRKKKRNE